MGVKQLREGISNQTGSLKGVLSNILKQNPITNPYQQKYGNILSAPSNVQTSSFNLQSNEQTNNTKATSQSIFCNVAIISSEPQPLPSDPNKKVTLTSYIVVFNNQGGNSYNYFKSQFFIDNQLTDEVANVQVNGSITCGTSTLENNKNNCQLTDEMRKEITKPFESHEDYQSLLTLLNMVK